MSSKKPVVTVKMLLDTGAFTDIDETIKPKLGLGKPISTWRTSTGNYELHKFIIRIGSLKPIVIHGNIGPLDNIYNDRPDIGLLGFTNNCLSQFIMDITRYRAIITDRTTPPPITNGKKTTLNIVS